MSELPTGVADGENIVRAIKTPYHLNKKKTALDWRAFKPPPGTDDLSVMRLDYLGANATKDKAVEICRESYVGLGVIRVFSIRAAGSEVFDSRDEFWGHAHISHGIVIPLNEPPSSAESAKLTERLKRLVQSTVYYTDPSPTSPGWSGDALLPMAAPD